MTTMPLWSLADIRTSNVDKKSKEGEPAVRLVNYTDVYYHQRITPDLEFMNATASPEHIARFRVRPDDVIITKDSEAPNDIGIPAIVTEADADMVCAYHLSLLRPDSKRTDARFLYWVLESEIAKQHWLTSSFGVTRYSILSGTIARLGVPAHDLDTQKRIADYLDRETGEIDAMLARMDELTATLEARRVSSIRRATQFAADGRRWNTVPTAHLFGSIGSGTTPKDQSHYTESPDGVPWVTTSELRESLITETSKRVTPDAIANVSSLRVHSAGAVVIAMYGATIGRLGTLGVDATMNQACCAFSDPQGVDLRYFYYTLWGQRDDIILLAVGGGQPNISQTMLRRWRVPSPPVAEQTRIADHLDEVTGKIDQMLAKTAELKSLLIERRSALITDVVTGKKQVHS